MSGASWERCKEVFGELLRLPDDARQRRLSEVSAEDGDLALAMRALLDGHARCGDFLEPPTVTRSMQRSMFERTEARAPDEDAWIGTIVGGRFRLRGRIGAGAVGDVYAADDLLTGETVACKLLRHRGWGDAAGGLRAEIAALRLLRIPGVVRMLEEGAEDGWPYLVTERIAGSPFPGAPRPAQWPGIAETTISLLETLDRVHSAGFVHRDLKPANVLVDAEGRPTVLDLGVALHPGQRPHGRGDVVGTPNYVSPEQLGGRAATPASDLYAVGVMLHEALTGRLPHEAASLEDLVVARRSAPPPLGDDAPADVANLVNRLLQPDPDARPRTATEALALLDGSRARCGPARLPWLGGDDVVRAIVAAATRGESLDVSGTAGSGRSRILDEAAERLAGLGWDVHLFRPDGGHSTLIDDIEQGAFDRLSEVRALAHDRLVERLRAGVVVLADDWSHLEPWIGELLAGVRGEGTVVRMLETPAKGALEVPPLPPEALRALFHGPDRVFHLREDGAALLHARTRGHPALVTEEVAAWIRGGHARWEGERLAVTREALDHLTSLGPGVPLRSCGRSLAEVPRDLARLAALVQLAGRQATPEGLAPPLGVPAWRVDARLQQLRTLGLVQYEEGGVASPLVPFDLLSVLSQEELRTAHGHLAAGLPPGHADRIGHLLAARELAAVPEEARLRARELLAAGATGAAIQLLGDALLLLREEPTSPALVPILEDLVHTGLLSTLSGPLHRALYELELAPLRDPHVHRLAQLARAALVLFEGAWERCLVSIERMEPFADARHELARQTVRVLAARRGGLARERATVAEVSRWAATCGLREARRSVTVWLAWLRYKEERFEEAARLHGRAAELADYQFARVMSLCSRTSALMDGLKLEAAWEALGEALHAFGDLRDSGLEVRLLCTERQLLYRLDRAASVDAELVEIAGQAGVPNIEAVAALTEAAVAWRLGDHDTARRYAARATRLWRSLDLDQYVCLPLALEMACSPRASEAEVRELVTMIGRCPHPGLAVQASGLLAIAHPDHAGAAPPPAELAAALTRSTFPVRREILSVKEAIDGCVERRVRNGTAAE